MKKKGKKKKKKDFSAKHIILIILFWVIFILILSFLLTSDYFNLDEIEVVGNKQITEEEALNLVELEKGKNIFIQKYYISKKNLESLPNVEKASIMIAGIDKIRIKITERKEKYQISTEDGYYTIDGDGYILRKLEERQKITMVSGLNVEPENESKLKLEDLHILENINMIYDTAVKLQIDALISEIQYDGVNYILIFDTEKKKATISGRLENLTAQMTMIKGILDMEKGKSGEIYQEKNEEKDWMIFRENV